MSWLVVLVLLVVVLLVLLGLGIWVPVSLAAAGIIGLLIDSGLPGLDALGAVTWNALNSFVLSPIPLFILMGEAVLRSGVSDRFYDAVSRLTRRVPGGLLHANIVTAGIFSALSGVSVTTAATVGTVAIPTLRARGYETRMTVGSIAGGGTLGILIPPSIPLIIYGVIAQESIVRLFSAAIIPGVLLLCAFLVYIAVRCALDPRKAPRSDGHVTDVGMLRLCATGVVPVLAIILIMFGGMFLGFMTPTEAAGVGAFVSLAVAGFYGGWRPDRLRAMAVGTVTTTSMILFIVLGGNIFAYALGQLGVTRELATWTLEVGLLPGVFLALTAIIYIVMGFFFDPISIMILTLPLLIPALSQLGINLIWFGVFAVILIEMGLITPPVGLNLFVINGIDSGYSLGTVARGALPYHLIMLGSLFVLALFPALATWLPQRL